MTTPRTYSQDGATVFIRPANSAFELDLRSVYAHWELLYFLVWKDIKIRYAQMALGMGWTILQPLITMLIFTAIFSRLAGIPSDGYPYPLFVYAALLPWTYFSQAVTRSGSSVVNNAALITKVYFPRLIIPLSAVLSPLVDLAVGFLILVGLMAWYGIVPTVAIVVLPLFVVVCVLTALAITLWLSALCVRYRDVGVIIPFLVQVGMYASPVAYPVSQVPERFQTLYSLNPMVGVIEGFRWALLGSDAPNGRVMAVSMAAVLLILWGGLVYFKKMERSFADIV